MKSLKNKIFMICLFGMGLFFFTTQVLAESISIKNITFVEKSDSTIIVSEPTFNALTINFNLQFYKIDDYATYRISIQNTTDKDILIQNNGSLSAPNNEYFTYEYNWVNNDSTIKANSTKEFDLKVIYTTKASAESFNEDGVIINNQVVNLDLATNIEDSITSIIENPNTSDSIIEYIILGISLSIILFDLIYFLYTKNHNKQLNIYVVIISLLLLGSSIFIKFSYAYKVVTISINTNINIKEIPVMEHNCFSNAEYFDDQFDRDTYLPETNNCLNWDNYTYEVIDKDSEISKYIGALIIINTNNLPDQYELNNIVYTKGESYDISEKQNKRVMLGLYQNGYNILYLIGGEGGVAAPQNSRLLFTGKDITSTGFPYRTGKLTDENLFSLINYFDLHNLDVSNVTNMEGMFYNYDSYIWNEDSTLDFTLNLSGWDTSNVTNMRAMFFGSPNSSKKNLNIDISSFNTSNVTNMKWMFTEFGNSINNISLDLSGFNTSKVTDMSSMFSDLGMDSNNISLDISNFDTSKVTTMVEMFDGMAWYANNSILKMPNFNTSNVTDMSRMFENCPIYNDQVASSISNFDTSNVTTMAGMFRDSFSLDNIQLDLSKWNTSNVTNMTYMFSGLGKASPNLYINNFDFSKVSQYNFLFSNMDANSKIYVKDLTTQQYVLNLSSLNRPSTWTTDNVLINQ